MTKSPWEKVEAELMSRIGDDGVLKLSMKDIRNGVSFKNVDLNDLRGSRRPGYHARKVILTDKGKTRILKER